MFGWCSFSKRTAFATGWHHHALRGTEGHSLRSHCGILIVFFLVSLHLRHSSISFSQGLHMLCAATPDLLQSQGKNLKLPICQSCTKKCQGKPREFVSFHMVTGSLFQRILPRLMRRLRLLALTASRVERRMAQKHALGISGKFASQFSDLPENPEVMVDSTYEFVAKAQDFILLSCVRSNQFSPQTCEMTKQRVPNSKYFVLKDGF